MTQCEERKNSYSMPGTHSGKQMYVILAVRKLRKEGHQLQVCLKMRKMKRQKGRREV